jgi:hypothetical protein
VFENGVLRRIFETKKEKVRRGWRKLYNCEHHDINMGNMKLFWLYELYVR